MTLSTLNSDQELKVLSPRLREKLRMATYATRVLTANGYRVIRQDLRISSERPPLLTVSNGDEALREELRQIQIAFDDGGRNVLGRYLEVELSLPQH